MKAVKYPYIGGFFAIKMDVQVVALVAAFLGACVYVYNDAKEKERKKQRRKRRHSCWVKNWREGRVDPTNQNTFFKLQRRIRSVSSFFLL